MADKKISELTSITGANVDDANDTIAIVDSSAGQTKKITRAELFNSVSGATFTDNITVSQPTAAVALFEARSELAAHLILRCDNGSNRRIRWGDLTDLHGQLMLRPTDVQFTKADNTVTHRLRQDGLLAEDTDVVTRGAGDARYAQLSGADFTGNLTLTNPRLGTLKVKRGSDGREWGIGTVGDSTAMSVYDVDNDAVVARFDEAGTGTPGTATVITREKGDARYIAERGSNSNGEYVRFSDGTQICYRTIVTTGIAVTTAAGSLYVSALQSWTYPATFVSTPTIATTGLRANDAVVGGVSLRNAPTNGSASYLFWLTSSTAAGGGTRQGHLTAIGRWK